MIIAEFNPQNRMVWFSDPLENFKPNCETAIATSQADAVKMVYFRNRNYIYSTLTKWLNQRAHALRDQEAQTTIANLLYWLETKQGSYYNLCAYVQHKAGAFESLAPGKKSRCKNYYDTVIQSIINDCKSLAN